MDHLYFGTLIGHIDTGKSIPLNTKVKFITPCLDNIISIITDQSCDMLSLNEERYYIYLVIERAVEVDGLYHYDHNFVPAWFSIESDRVIELDKAPSSYKYIFMFWE